MSVESTTTTSKPDKWRKRATESGGDILVSIDCECTGLPQFPRRKGHLFPPHMLEMYDGSRPIEIGWATYNVNDGRMLNRQSFLCFPSGEWAMDPMAESIHGISRSTLQDTGNDTSHVMDLLASDLQGARVLLGHNLPFDVHVLHSEALRIGHASLPEMLMASGLQHRCTMRGYTQAVGLVRYNGLFKWPSLDELFEFCFGRARPSAGRHRALSDAMITAKCYFSIELGVSQIQTARIFSRALTAAAGQPAPLASKDIFRTSATTLPEPVAIQAT